MVKWHTCKFNTFSSFRLSIWVILTVNYFTESPTLKRLQYINEVSVFFILLYSVLKNLSTYYLNCSTLTVDMVYPLPKAILKLYAIANLYCSSNSCTLECFLTILFFTDFLASSIPSHTKREREKAPSANLWHIVFFVDCFVRNSVPRGGSTVIVLNFKVC